MSKIYWFSFSPNPSDTANLTPVFLNFAKFDGTTLAAPGITQPFTGTGFYQFTYTPTFSIAFKIDGATTGGGLTTSIRYIVGSLDPSDRTDELLAEQGSTLSAIGMSNVALGTTGIAIGTTNVSYGVLNNALGTTSVALGTTNAALGTTSVALGITSISYEVLILAAGSSAALSNAAIGSTASVYGSSSTDPVDLFGYLKRIREFLEGNQGFDKSTGSWSIYSRSSATLLITKTLTNAAAGVTRA